MNEQELLQKSELLDVLTSVLLYVEAKSKPVNPFVRRLGKTEDQEALETLVFSAQVAFAKHRQDLEDLNALRQRDLESQAAEDSSDL